MSAQSDARARAVLDPIELWTSLLRPDVELSEAFWVDLSARMREARLSFGDRPLCPFLRPFFLDEADEARVAPRRRDDGRRSARRSSQAAMASPELLRRGRA